MQLPTFMTAPAGAAADGRQRDGSGGVELKANASNGKGGVHARGPGMTASDRIVMVENASDRIIMVDVGGSGGGTAGSAGGGGQSGG